MSDLQLRELIKPIPMDLSDEVRGNRYFPHGVISQYLLAILQEPYEIVEIREVYSRDDPSVIAAAVVSFLFTVDGKQVVITEVGDTESAYVTKRGSDDDYLHDNGHMLKACVSDALKRASRHLGLGLQLWNLDKGYFLPNLYNKMRTYEPEKVIAQVELLNHMYVEKYEKGELEEISEETIEAITSRLVERDYQGSMLLHYLFGKTSPEDLTQPERYAFVFYFGERIEGNYKIRPSSFKEARELVEDYVG